MKLRCHRCSHYLVDVAVPMELAGIFDGARMPRVPRADAREVRKRCLACGWLNVFHPAGASAPVEVKTGVPA